jgi:threonyl-tRNA synthetase
MAQKHGMNFEEAVGKKVRKAAGEKIPYIVVIGDREAAGEIWTIRVRGQDDQIKMMEEEFKEKMLQEIKERR